MAALPLLKKLRERYPSRNIILSTVTDTGQKVGRNGAPEGTSVFYLPFDIPFVLRTVLRQVKPDILITIETELWPNVLRVFKEQGVPIVLLNGRISKNSFEGYKKVSFFMRRVLSCVDLFCMQSDLDAERVRSLGVNREKVKVLGNFKFDTMSPSAIPEWAERISGPVLIAGSTHEGEEELMISTYHNLKKDFPHLNLIIAPRHPERFKEVENLLRSKGMVFVRRSEFLQPLNTDSPLSGTIILLDTVGELSTIYGIADIAIIGKSFKGYGGQNPLEPAYWGKPIVCGPHMENFPFIREFYSRGAALEVNEENFFPIIRELLLSPEKAKEIGLKAKDLYTKNAGAVDRAMEVIEGYVHD
jgi:3-deoxy-D-manno-octulosonic-acid transferase